MIKTIKEAYRLSKDFDKRLKEVERNITEPSPQNVIERMSFSMANIFKPTPLHVKVSKLKSRINDLEKKNKLLMDYLKVEEKTIKAKKECKKLVKK